MKTVGRFFNVIGPFLAAIPVTTQITGVSDHSAAADVRELVAEDPSRSYWICSNELGVDELLSIEDSRVYDSARGEEFTLEPGELGLGAGSFDELLPVEDIDDSMSSHFLALIGGDGPPAALESIRLNAAALAINAEVAGGLAGGAPAGRRRDGERRAGQADRAAAGPRQGICRARAQGLVPSASPASSPRGLPAVPGWRCS